MPSQNAKKKKHSTVCLLKIFQQKLILRIVQNDIMAYINS
jgi:hypothetical protein